jgi:hypothetical protein
VAVAAVGRRHARRDDESVMVLALLPVGRLVALEAVDAFARVHAQFVFVDDGVLRVGVTLRTLTRSPDERGRRLLGYHRGRYQFGMKAATSRAVPIATAMKTDRKAKIPFISGVC